MTSCAMAPSNIDIRQLLGSYSTHQLCREECHFKSTQIPSSHAPIWFVRGAAQCSMAKAVLRRIGLTAFSHPEKKNQLFGKSPSKKTEIDKRHNKGKIAFWCSLFSVSFKEQYVNRTDAGTDMTWISYWCRNFDFCLLPHWLVKRIWFTALAVCFENC